MMPPEFISSESCDVHLFDTSPASTAEPAALHEPTLRAAIDAIRGSQSRKEAIAAIEGLAVSTSASPDPTAAVPSKAVMWKPGPGESVEACLRNSFTRAISLLRSTGHTGDSIDAARLEYARATIAQTAPAPTQRASNSRTVQEDELLDAVMLDAGTSVGYRLERLFKVLSVAEGRALRAAPVQQEAEAVTQAMISAGAAAAREYMERTGGNSPEAIYRAMRRAALQPTEGEAPMAWPKARDVGRIGDMSPRAHMRVGFDSDSDVFVSVWSDDGGGSVEFCTAGAGGGKSPRTREALIGLMVAMEGENAIDPGRDWWARRNRTPVQGAGDVE